ncbi:MAG: Asp23/Gls24 family envelope stress response protein [Acidaminococcaceae bacterium]|nr:Asp23/Gls24 family envelope stress response protein [Acidaminococcaceae bacterium]MDD4722588.1 Asp23/Gls24 family envelope stress response protein [Acidaminococcaceae bacterium]
MMDDEDFGKKSKNVENENIPDEVGSLKIADEVLSIVAGLAVAEVQGVAGMSGGIVGGITEMLGKQNFSKGIKVIPTGKTVMVEIYVIVKYGFNIPDVAIAIQEKVKTAVENMTGFDVTSVDVHVEGIRRQAEINIGENAEEASADSTSKYPKTEGME